MNLTPIISKAFVASTHPNHCDHCNACDVCLPAHMNEFEMEAANRIVQLRKTIKKGNRLFKTGMKFHAIYTIRSGFFKTTLNSAQGHIQLLSFHMKGDSLGWDGMAFELYQSDAVALVGFGLSQRLHARGFSRYDLLLRMTRIEMAQYLGLTQETVCRTLTKLSGTGVLSINQRHLHILNMPALERITGQ